MDLELNKLEYDPTFMNTVNLASVRGLKEHGIKHLGRYVIKDSRLEFTEDQLKQFELQPETRMERFKSYLSRSKDKAKQAIKTAHSVISSKANTASFRLHEEKNESREKTLFQLYKRDDDAYAVFHPVSNGFRNTYDIERAIDIFRSNSKPNQLRDRESYVTPKIILLPVLWLSYDEEEKITRRLWSLVKIKPNYGGTLGWDKSNTEIVIYGQFSSESQRKELRKFLKGYTSHVTNSKLPEYTTLIEGEKKIKDPVFSDRFRLDTATQTADGGPWVNRNIRTIIMGGEPSSRNKLDTHIQYGHYYRHMKHPKIAERFENMPLNLWRRIRWTVAFLVFIVSTSLLAFVLGLTVPAFGVGIATAFLTGFGATASTIAGLSSIQLACIATTVIGTLSTLAVGVYMAGVALVKRIFFHNKDAKEDGYNLLDLGIDDGDDDDHEHDLPSTKDTKKELGVDKSESKEEKSKARELWDKTGGKLINRIKGKSEPLPSPKLEQ